MRRRVAVLFMCAAALTLTACVADGPTEADRTAWSQWFSEVTNVSAGNTLGAQMGDADGQNSSRMDFAEPLEFASVELRCIGSDSAAFTLTYAGANGSMTLTQDIVCHGGEPLTAIAVPTEMGPLTSFAATATSSDAEGYWVATLQP